MSSRHFQNNLDKEKGGGKELKIDQLRGERDSVLSEILEHPPSDQKDTTVYTGYGGTILLLLRLFETQHKEKGSEKYLSRASHLLDTALKCVSEHHPEKEITFIEGYAGMYAIATVVKHYEQNEEARTKFCARLLSYFELVMKESGRHSVDSNELLYGRAGYIQALLYCFKHTHDIRLLEKAETITKLLVKQGRNFSHDIKSKSPLMYSWHEKRYTGFAHGVTGIAYMIISVFELLQREREKLKKSTDWEWWEQTMKDVRHTVDFIASTVYPSGNYPTRDDGTEDILVQWCHGAPAAVILFCKAFEIFRDEKYKNLAVKACEVVWERGLLRKGFGLCHGISGNAYCFLYTYKITLDPQFLQRAVKFSTFCWADKALYDELIQTPEAPHSLFEGIGGLAYLYNDLFLICTSPDFSSYSFPTCEF